MNLLIGLAAFLLIGLISGIADVGWRPSEAMIRGVVYGSMLIFGLWVIALLRAAWRKLTHKSPVQRL